jgi:HD-like signal output (HDOD) protein
MATKNILLAVADPQTVADINQALGDEWLTTPVASEEDALALLEAAPFDALLADFNLGDPDASNLVNQALEKCPKIIRFLLAYEADLALVAAKVVGSPELLPKPIEPASLKSRIENGLRDPDACEAGTATGFDAASLIPPVYTELLQTLDAPEVTSQRVGRIIAGDPELTRAVLQLTRSAYRGLPGDVANPAEAVEVLGLEAVRALVLARRFLAEHSHVRPGYLSLEHIWRHSARVGQIARDLVLFETKDRALASQALAAGLLHDLGKVVLAVNFDDLYGRVHSLARKQPVALWDIEKEMFGANHGEIGACLLGMWNLPAALVEAAAFHHDPPLGEQDQLTPLAAVHIANVLEHQLRPDDEFRVVPVVNMPYLNQLGLLQRLAVWRAAFANEPAHAPPSQTGTSPATAPPSPGESAPREADRVSDASTGTWTGTAAPEDAKSGGTAAVFGSWPRRWVYAAAIAGLSFGLALWLRFGPDAQTPTPVHARSLARQQEIATVSPAPSLALTPDSASTVAPATTASPEAPAENDSFVPDSTTAPEVVATNLPPVGPPPQAAAPSFRLGGVIYGVSKPSAIVNGKRVYAGDVVNGATVVRIGRSDVTLEVNGERRTLSLRAAH